MFTSDSEEWETPPYIIEALLKALPFDRFDLDPCCTRETAKGKRHYTKEENGLVMPWEGNVFMNPPYGGEISKWIYKAVNEYHQLKLSSIVMLLPARTDTSWWHHLSQKCFVFFFIQGRIKFRVGGRAGGSAPFPSALVWNDLLEVDLDVLYSCGIHGMVMVEK